MREAGNVVQDVNEKWEDDVREKSRHRKWRVDTYRDLKEAIREADEVALPESGLYFDALEARIMGALNDAIESGEVVDRKRRLTFVPPVRITAPIRGAAARAGHVFVVGGIALTLMGKWLMSGEGIASGQSVFRESKSQPMSDRTQSHLKVSE